MKSFDSLSIKALAIICIIGSVEVAFGQTRYKDVVFPSATVTKGIQFGSNLGIGGTNTDLLLDFYEPASDTATARPLVICIHGGSLIVGDRTDMGGQCTDLAKRGYVAATIDYRLGIENPKGVRTILEALLRGVQDAKAAVRFFRSKAAQYKIDTSHIYIEGSSAGSMIADHYAYWNQDEIPSDVNQAKWGDIEGTSGNPGFSSKIDGIVNYCGAILDASWIDAGEVPVGNFHGLLDTIVPADSGVSGDFGIMMYGGVAISRAALKFGIYHQDAFFPYGGHGTNPDSVAGFASNFFYSLLVLSSSRQQDFSSLDVTANSLRVFRYDTYTFQATAHDLNGNVIVLPQPMLQYSCDARIGTIQPTGVFTPAAHPDSGYVRVMFNNSSDSCFVRTYDLKYFTIRPRLAVADTLTPLQLSIDTFDADSVKHALAITNFTLTSSNPSVGTIDPSGVFTGRRSGTTKIVATCSSYSDTCVIRVESARGLVSLDQLETLSGWRFEGANLDSLSVTLATDQKSEGNASFRIGYKFTYDPLISSYMVYLYKDALVYGIPDSIYLDVKSDGRRHRLYYSFSDANSGVFRASAKKYLNNSQIFDLVNTPMTGLSVVTAAFPMTPPLTLTRIEIQLSGDLVQGQSTSGTIYIDNLRLKYPGMVTGVEMTPIAPALFSLGQNYPNPFNPATIIRYAIPKQARTRLDVYDVLGRLIVTLVDADQVPGYHQVPWNASGIPSGVYLYRVQAGNYVATKKMILLR